MTAFRARHFCQASVAVATIIGGSVGGLRTALHLAAAALNSFLVARTPDRGCGCTPPSISPTDIQHNQPLNIRTGFRELLREFPIEPPNISVTSTALILVTADDDAVECCNW